MKSWKLCIFACGVAALGSAGCKGDSAGVRFGVATAETTELAAVVCEAAFGCCEDNEIDYFLSPYLTEEDCADRLIGLSTFTGDTFEFDEDWLELPLRGIDFELPNLAALDRAVAEERIGIDSEALAACATFLRAQECDPEFEESEECDPDVGQEEYPCDADEILFGRVTEGGACDFQFHGLECADGFVCVNNYAGFAFSLVKDAGASGTCERQRDVDEPCFYDDECRDELYCQQLDGTCQVPRALDEACQYSNPDEEFPSESTLLIACESHLTCSPFTETCVARCSVGAECFSDNYCATDLVCVANDYCDQPRVAGEACENSSDCADGFACNTADSDPGQCEPLLGNGTNCVFHSQCASGYCEGTCQPTIAVGGACTSDPQCGDNLCDDSVALCGATLDCPGLRTCSAPADAENDAPCNAACVALKADGQECATDDECASDLCVSALGDTDPGVCGTAPFLDGERCSAASQCESEMCNLGADPAICISSPLANGADCSEDEHCTSAVCYGGTCQAGLALSATCGPALAPCDPFTAFCDTELESPECADIKETGEECERDIECRSGDCDTRWGRRLCSEAAGPDGLICGADYEGGGPIAIAL